ncbi:MAG TPA: hypothetical protein VL402_12300 [Xanthobacteraceae bacterium]|jgi:hypothetical protein|nr:hypothetical protein [Xanthobacteraceae bacterium]
MAEKSKKDEAQAQFKKMQRAEDGKKAMTEYEAEAIATRAKTERLKALRLARDASAPPPAPKKVAVKKTVTKTSPTGARITTKTAAKTTVKKAPAKARGKVGTKTGTLSDWMEAEKASGRNN